MAIKYNGHDLQKRMYNGHEVQKVMYNGNQIRPTTPPVPTYDYLNFTAVGGNAAIKLEKWGRATEVNLEVSWDKIDWMDYTIEDYITILEGNTLYWRNKSTTPTGFSNGGDSYYVFYSSWTDTGNLEANGSVMYLLCKNHTTELQSSGVFYNLFSDCNTLITAPQLPATVLTEDCYSHMFWGCPITTPPILPATTLANGCYSHMFDETAITTPPILPATTLAERCYDSMFEECVNLTTPPTLPATTLAARCYSSMFEDCTNLASLPSLPATTLQSFCYWHMFDGCSNIKLSDQPGGIYQTPYTIPSSGGGTDATSSLGNMFDRTGGEWTGTPEINRTYYTSNQVI